MFDTSFDHSIIRKYYAYFASLFSNIHIDRTDENGNLLARIKVPIHFAKKEKALTRVHDDPNIDRKDAIFVPVMAFDMVDMKYAENRKTPTMNRMALRSDDVNKFWTTHVAVPYDFHFQLYIMVKNVNDGLKIVEQILPYFQPDVTAKLEIVPEMEIFQDIPVVLSSVTYDDKVDSNFNERVSRVWVIDFVLQGVLYGPVKKTPIIKFANVIFTGLGGGGIEENPFMKTTTQPGLTANGEPTTNVNNTVSYLTISIDDDYGYIVTNTSLPEANNT